MSKYRSVKTVVDNIKFDSKKESERYTELKLLERTGEIRNLELQPRLDVRINGKYICYYKADFSYFTEDRRVFEDVKSSFTAKLPMFRLKKKLVEACYPGVKIMEILK